MIVEKSRTDPEKLIAIIAQQRLQIQEYKSQNKKPNKALLKKINQQAKQIKALDAENEILREALRLARMKRFASTSEELSSDQPELFNEAEVLSSSEKFESEESEDDGIEIPAHKRRRGKRKPLPDNLPREDVVVDLSEENKFCSKDGTALVEIGSDVSEKLDIIPTQFKVIRTILKKYICPCCQRNNESHIESALLPETILPKSYATPGLLAYIATSKYVDALPLYRIEQQFKRYEIEIPRNTMARWMIELTEPLLPLYHLMEEDLLASDYVCCDETHTQVLKEKDKTPQSRSYMWVRARHGPGTGPIILFDYDPTRSGEVPKMLLKGMRGYLQVDGYAAYDALCDGKDVVRVGCMAHVRRKFMDVYKASKQKSAGAQYVLKKIKGLYKIEKEITDKGIEDRKQTRLEQSRPILDKIRTWLDNNQNRYPPSGLMGKAITYAINQWAYVSNYLLDGRLSIDNNFIENRIRPFAVGRKNWLFSDTVEGAKASAMIYSILQSARGNGHEPYAYMRYLLTHLPHCKTAEELERLLPHKIDPKLLY